MTHSRRTFPLLALLALALPACSAGEAPATQAASTDVAADASAAMDESASPAQVMAAAGCFLQRGTLSEAAERPSPLDSATVVLGGAEAKICYGSASLNGRVMLGEIEPFGTPWRSGANEATGLHLAFPAQVAGVGVAAGSYSLYTIPGESTWEVVINSRFERWGIPINDEVRAADLGSMTVDAETLAEPVERLTYRWEQQSATEAHLILEWQTTRIRIPVVKGGS